MNGQRVYLSSTFQDLRDFREKANEALRQAGFELVAMEDYPAFDDRPIDKCLRDVASADFYVGILAWRYGSVPDEGNPDRKSISELEYDRAGEKGIPRFVFLLDPDADWKRSFDDRVTGEGEGGASIDRFRELVAKHHGRGLFSNKEELARKVLAALQAHVKTGGRPKTLQTPGSEELPQARLLAASVEWKRKPDPDPTPRRWVVYLSNHSNAPIIVESVVVKTKALQRRIPNWGPIRPGEIRDYELDESLFDPTENPRITTRFTDSLGKKWVLEESRLRRDSRKSG